MVLPIPHSYKAQDVFFWGAEGEEIQQSSHNKIITFPKSNNHFEAY